MVPTSESPRVDGNCTVFGWIANHFAVHTQPEGPALLLVDGHATVKVVHAYWDSPILPSPSFAYHQCLDVVFCVLSSLT